MSSSLHVEKLEIVFVTDFHFKRGVKDNPDADGAIKGKGINPSKFYYTVHAKMKKFCDIVNARKDQIDLLVNLGDSVDSPNDMSSFKKLWETIDTDIKKELLIGNHDYSDFSYEELVEYFGYQERFDVGNSKFNQTFVLNKGLRNEVRFILVDVVYEESQSLKRAYPKEKGLLHPETEKWLESVLKKAKENTICLCTHYGLVGHFEEESQKRLLSLIKKAKSNNSALKFYNVYGHVHSCPSLMYFDSLEPYVSCYQIPTVVNYEVGKFVICNVDKNGGLSFVEQELPY